MKNKRLLRWTASSATLVFFWAIDYFRLLTDPWNRFCYVWQLSDLGLHLLALVVLSGILMGGGFLLSRIFPRLQLHKRLMLILAFLCFWPLLVKPSSAGASAISYIDLLLPNTQAFLFPITGGAESLLMFTVISFVLIFLPLRFSEFVNSCLIALSPIVAAFFLSGLFFHTYTARYGSFPQTHSALAGKNPQNIYFFLFDEWDYSQSFENKEPRGDLKAIRDLCSTATVFHNAITPAGYTIKSVPYIIGAPSISTEEFGRCVRAGKPIDGYLTPSIFSDAKNLGYRCYLVSGFLNYSEWVKKDMDFFYTAGELSTHGFGPLYSVIEPLWQIMTGELLYYFPFGARIDRFRFELKCHLRKLRLVHSLALQLIRSVPNRSLLYFHYPIPHDPYVFSADHPLSLYQQTAANYHHNLLLVDSHMSELLKILKETGQWENSLFIFTGDHGCKALSPPRDKQHAALIIKFPGQHKRLDVDDRVYTKNVRAFIKNYLGHGAPSYSSRYANEVTEIFRAD